MKRMSVFPMRNIRNGWITSAAVAALALMACLCAAQPVAGQEPLPEILPINPVPDVELVRYDVSGKLDELRDDAVIVNDSRYSLSIDEGVKFFVEGSPAPVYKSYFEAGDLVGCVYDDFSRVKEIWKLSSLPDR
jgi:hypothetical protein